MALPLLMMFFALVAGGCGGGGSSGGSFNGNGNSNNGWDTDPDERNQNNNGNNNNQNNNNNDNGNNNQNVDNGTPVAINGTWEIVSGHAVVLSAGQRFSLTYKPGSVGNIGIEMVSNGNDYDGLYTLNLTGDVIADANGIGMLEVEYSYDDYPSVTMRLPFVSYDTFKYIGNGTYEIYEENFMNSGVTARYTVTLENPSTLHLYYETTDSSSQSWHDIYLRKVQ